MLVLPGVAGVGRRPPTSRLYMGGANYVHTNVIVDNVGDSTQLNS